MIGTIVKKVEAERVHDEETSVVRSVDEADFEQRMELADEDAENSRRLSGGIFVRPDGGYF
jgi:hypothetical protein